MTEPPTYAPQVQAGPNVRVLVRDVVAVVTESEAADIVRQMNTCATAPGWIVFTNVDGHTVRVWSTHLVALEPVTDE